MKLQDVLTKAGKHKQAKRVGRGHGSGNGKTAGRGHKGYGQRAGAKSQAGFEGGQNPQIRRVPKRGFNNAQFAETVETVNVCELQRCFADGETVTVDALATKGLIDRTDVTVKLLGKGELTHKLTVQVTCASKGAADKVAAAGGTLELAGA